MGHQNQKKNSVALCDLIYVCNIYVIKTNPTSLSYYGCNNLQNARILKMIVYRLFLCETDYWDEKRDKNFTTFARNVITFLTNFGC